MNTYYVTTDFFVESTDADTAEMQVHQMLNASPMPPGWTWSIEEVNDTNPPATDQGSFTERWERILDGIRETDEYFAHKEWDDVIEVLSETILEMRELHDAMVLLPGPWE